jgi:hypothetical protein
MRGRTRELIVSASHSTTPETVQARLVTAEERDVAELSHAPADEADSSMHCPA